MSLSTRQHAVKTPALDSRSAAGDAVTALVIPIIQLRGHFTRAGEAIARTGGQTLARWLVLETVASAPATVAQVARALGLTRQSVQRVADLLARDGLTEYIENPKHERSKLVRPTARGLGTLRAIQAAQRVWADGVGAEVGEADLRHASRVVNRLTRALRTDRARRASA
jgi:DNA-binding MarR family transcriptional regulator